MEAIKAIKPGMWMVKGDITKAFWHVWMKKSRMENYYSQEEFAEVVNIAYLTGLEAANKVANDSECPKSILKERNNGSSREKKRVTFILEIDGQKDKLGVFVPDHTMDDKGPNSSNIKVAVSKVIKEL